MILESEEGEYFNCTCPSLVLEATKTNAFVYFCLLAVTMKLNNFKGLQTSWTIVEIEEGEYFNCICPLLVLEATKTDAFVYFCLLAVTMKFNNFNGLQTSWMIVKSKFSIFIVYVHCWCLKRRKLTQSSQPLTPLFSFLSSSGLP